MIITILFGHENISGDLSSFPNLETTVNQTSYDTSTLLPINISNDTHLVTDLLFTNLGKSSFFSSNLS
jgi:hypothetical protein